jgi:DNA mismatch repair protein MutS2
MSNFDPQTLKDLEFGVIQEVLEAYGIGPTAKNRLMHLEPTSDFPKLLETLTVTKEFHTLRTTGELFPAMDYEELTKEIILLPIKNATLEQEGFVRISRASELVNLILVFFDKREKDFPKLNQLLKNVYFTTEIIVAIDKVFDRKGQVKDDASPELYRIRKLMQTVRSAINKNFEKELRRLTKEGILGDTKEAFIDQRRVLTVQSTHKRKLSGSVLGSSKTGSLTYIEPQSNILLNNEFEMLMDDERKEIFRILQQLTADISGFAHLIEGYHILLTELDFINAKVKLAIELDCNLPSIGSETKIELINAFHPLLLRSNRLLGKKTLPQNLIMDRTRRMLVISGPNAGGKSITMKTIGLLQLMLQAGLLVPVDENSVMSFFQNVLTDIGDNQSIENELSTYSYRLKRMKHFLTVSGKRTLLLLDEFGTGSDPDLGGALAEVFFEELYNRKAFGVITTHYANIKLKADRLQNAMNGCMLFNTETLEPLYRFSMGQPGSSFTFEVAQINGIPIDLIELAKSKMDVKKVEMDKLLSELQREKTYLERLNKEHIEAQRLAQNAKNDYEQRKDKFEERLKAQQISIEQNNKYLNSGRKMSNFIDRWQLRGKKDVNQALIEDIKKHVQLEKAKIDDSKRIETMKAEVKNPKKKKVNLVPQKDPYDRDKIVIGSTVKMISTKQSGTVEEIAEPMLTVIFGFMRLKVEREKLMFLK